jgi:hypothetical protein
VTDPDKEVLRTARYLILSGRANDLLRFLRSPPESGPGMRIAVAEGMSSSRDNRAVMTPLRNTGRRRPSRATEIAYPL